MGQVWFVEAVMSFEHITPGTIIAVDPDKDLRLVALIGRYLKRRPDLEAGVEGAETAVEARGVDIRVGEPTLTVELSAEFKALVDEATKDLTPAERDELSAQMQANVAAIEADVDPDVAVPKPKRKARGTTGD